MRNYLLHNIPISSTKTGFAHVLSTITDLISGFVFNKKSIKTIFEIDKKLED